MFDVRTESLGRAEVLITELGDEVIVIDDFYREPDALRAHLLAEVHGHDVGFYGRTRVVGADELVGLHEPLAALLAESRLELFSFLARVTTRESLPHVDQHPIACTVYLNRGDEVDGGTGFYRHRRTGIYKLPVANGRPAYGPALREHGYPSLEAFLADHVAPREAWELYDLVPMAWNRAVLYSAALFHNSHFAEGFYDEARPRLSQNIFIRPEQP